MCPQYDQSSLGALWVVKDTILPRQWRLIDAQADLNCCLHSSFCRFCRALAQMTAKRKERHMSHLMTRPTKWPLHPAKTQISLCIRPVWSMASLPTWRNFESSATHWAHCEDTDQTGQVPRLIWVFVECTVILLVLLWCSLCVWTECKAWIDILNILLTLQECHQQQQHREPYHLLSLPPWEPQCLPQSQGLHQWCPHQCLLQECPHLSQVS